jgi:hypothetical protein
MPPFLAGKFGYRSELAGAQVVACSPGLNEQSANLGVRGLIEIAVELADRVKRLRCLDTDNLVNFAAQLFAGAGCRDRHRHDDSASDGTQGARCGFHAGTGREAIVDENGGAACERGAGAIVAIRNFAAFDLYLLTR